MKLADGDDGLLAARARRAQPVRLEVLFISRIACAVRSGYLKNSRPSVHSTWALSNLSRGGVPVPSLIFLAMLVLSALNTLPGAGGAEESLGVDETGG